jgi:ubiquinone/menaquinone biosynthesis C-methylase UbiE
MAFSDPKRNIEQFLLGEGMVVADFGSGPGLHAIAAARAVGDSGKVYAIDVQADMLTKLKTHATQEGVGNIEVLLGDLEELGGSKLREMSVDAVLVANTLFQIEDKETFLKEVSRVLKPKGKVLMIDWSDSFGGMGPQQEHLLTEGAMKVLFTSEGFKEEKSIDSGDHHYGYIFRKQT